jgi:hypothetical protein
MILFYFTSLKKEKHKTEVQLRDIEHQISNNSIIRLEDGQVYNIDDIKDPLIHKAKGVKIDHLLNI